MPPFSPLRSFIMSQSKIASVMKYALPGLGGLAGILGFAELASADNPIVQTIYTADPALVIHNDRLYVFTTHDEDGSTNFNMKDWRCFSTIDMANWQDHGVVANLQTFSWSSDRAWAAQAWPRNNKWYLYVPVQQRSGQMAIGVGVSENITGPYKDPLHKPLVANNEIDPSVFIDDDGQAYLFWGNPNLWYAKLNKDMISIQGSPVQVQLNQNNFGPRRSGTNNRNVAYEEAPWIYKRNNIYYLIYGANCCSEDLHYSTAPSVTGPWTHRGVVMNAEGGSFTNHPGVIDYKNSTYLFYHNAALPGGIGYTRSVSVEKFNYGSDGSIPTIRMTSSGPPQVGTLDPYVRVEAETIAFSSGLKTEVCSEGGMDVGNINNNDHLKVKGVAFGTTSPSKLSVRVASQASGGKIEVRVGGQSGTLVATCTVAGTGGWQTWTTVECPVSGATATQDVLFKFTGSGNSPLFDFNWWQFAA